MSTTSIPNDAHEGIQAALDLLLAREAALAAIWDEAARDNDAYQLLEIGGRQAELEGIIRMFRGAA